MKHYIVTWSIDIDADSAVEAAKSALAIQRNPESIATVFEVAEVGCERVEIDLLENTK